MTDLKGMIGIVTGASQGIGRAIAHSLAAAGVHVILASRNEEKLETVRKEIVEAEGDATVIPTDVTSEKSVQHLVTETIKRFGKIDILVNNAGIGYFKQLTDLSTEEFDTMMNVNLKGMFLCSRAVLPVMIKQQRGEIINIASLAGKNSFAGGTVYSASKWGVIGFSRSLMLEVRDDNIRVITIAPGSVNTKFGEKEKNAPEIILPEDVAETAVFALRMPHRTNVSEIDIRPTIKPRS